MSLMCIGPKRRFTATQRCVRSWSTSRHGADIVNVRLQPRHAPLVGSGPRSRYGSLAVFAAMFAGPAPLARRSDLR